MRKSLFFTAFLALFAGPLRALDSTQSGPWSSASTWGGATPPAPGVAANIVNGHSVTITGDIQAGVVTITSGTLAFDRVASSTLTLVAGDLTVGGSGVLDLGTEASPIPAGVKALLVLALGSSPGQYGLVVQAGGLLTVRGADKSPFALAASDALTGALSASVPSTGTAGWQVGDEVLLTKTERSSDFLQNERRLITGLSSSGGLTTVSWSTPLTADHRTFGFFMLANLNRNVVIKSSGSVTGGTSAYIEAPAMTSLLRLTQGEFSGLGTNTAGRYGVSGRRIEVSSSSFHDGHEGISLHSGNGSRVSNSLFALNEGGLVINNAGGGEGWHDLIGNAYLANLDVGLDMAVSPRNRIDGAYFLGTEDIAAFIMQSPYTVLKDVFAAGNVGGNASRGAVTFAFDSMYSFVQNAVVRNDTASGLVLESTDMIVDGLESSANAADGAGSLSARNTFLRPLLYGNQAAGIHLSGGIFQRVHGGSLGFNAASASVPNVSREISAGSALLFQNVRVNGAGTLVRSTDFNQSGRSLLLLSPPDDLGATHLWGDREDASFSLDYAAPIFRSTATAPVLIRSGNGGPHAAAITSTSDQNAVTQLISIVHDGTQWTVTGSVSGPLGSFSGDTAGLNLSQFVLSFDESGTPVAGDRLMFALVGATPDAGVQKRLIARGGSAGYNGGRSRLVLGAGGLSLQGVPGVPTLVTREGSTPYLTLISSGPTTVSHAELRYLDEGGLRLAGAGPVSISSSTFDQLVLSGDTNAFLTATNLSGTLESHGVVFGSPTSVPGPGQAVFNVRAPASGLAWDFHGWSGAASGPTYESDPGGNVHWLLQPPANPSAAGAPGQLTVSWSAPVSPTGPYFSHYRLRASAVSAAGPWLADVNTTATNHPLTGLADETLHYIELYTYGTTGAPAAMTTLTARTPDLIAPSSPTAVTAVTGTGLGEIRLDWTAPGDNLGAKTFLAGSAYAVQYSTLDPAVVVWSTSTAVVISTFGPAGLMASQSHTLTGLTMEAPHFVRVWLRDSDGNWSVYSSTAAAVPRLSPPLGSFAVSLLHTADRIVSRTPSFGLSFNRAMNAASLQSGFTVRRVRDNLGNAVNDPVSATLTGSGSSFQFQPASLAGNSVYELTVPASAADTQGNLMGTPLTARFTTVMNPQEENIWVLSAGRLTVPAGAIGEPAFIVAGAGPTAQAQAATDKLVANTADAHRRPIGAIVDLRLLDGAGAPLEARFARAMTLRFPYTDDNNDGIVDGTTPPVRAKTLTVHWLDESKNLWVPLSSRVDMSAHVVEARAPHFTSFAVIGALDQNVDESYAFPVPFNPAQAPGITFLGLPENAVIRVFTPSGKLMRKIEETDGDGQLLWDAKTDDGENVSSGVYVYQVRSGNNKKTGKLVIVR